LVPKFSRFKQVALLEIVAFFEGRGVVLLQSIQREHD